VESSSPKVIDRCMYVLGVLTVGLRLGLRCSAVRCGESKASIETSPPTIVPPGSQARRTNHCFDVPGRTCSPFSDMHAPLTRRELVQLHGRKVDPDLPSVRFNQTSILPPAESCNAREGDVPNHRQQRTPVLETATAPVASGHYCHRKISRQLLGFFH
jgi:hypothetical protein